MNNTLSKLQSYRGQALRQLVVAATLLALAFASSSRSAATTAGLIETDGGAPKTWMILPIMQIQNVLLKFALASYGQSDEVKIKAMREAETVIRSFVFQQRIIHRLETPQDLQLVKDQYFPAFNSVKDEFSYRRANVPPFYALSAGNEEMASHLDSMWRSQEEKLHAFGGLREKLFAAVDSSNVRALIFEALDHPNVAKLASHALPDEARLRIANTIQAGITQGLQQIDATGTVIAGSGALKHTDPGMQRFFELAIGEYFRGLDLGAKLNIVSAFLDRSDIESPREKFELMVMNSGPQFQKLFQVYARQEGFGEEMKSVFKLLESSARPAPFRLVKKEIAKLKNLNFEFVSINPKPLGVGTMAQVHRAQIRLSNGELRDVVVRVMKPGIRQRLRSDNNVLARIAPLIDADPKLREYNFPQITPFVNEIIAMGMQELKVPDTAAAQRKGTQVYRRDVEVEGRRIRFHVPDLYSTGENSMIMVQEFIEGTSFETFAHKDPVGARLAVEELSKLWLEQALLGDGFFHADLHQGNLRVGRTRDGAIQVNLLDFGMTGQIDKRTQGRMIALGVILGSRRADLMSEALWELSTVKENKITLPELRQRLQHELSRPLTSNYELGDWIATAASFGLKFPPEMTSLNRGMTLINQMLKNEKSQLEIATTLRRLLMKNPAQIRTVLTSMDSMSVRDWLTVATAGLRPAATPRAGRALTCEQIFAGH